VRCCCCCCSGGGAAAAAAYVSGACRVRGKRQV
jgi:hypothetical protein